MALASDRIVISGLEVTVRIGITEEERAKAQVIEVDAELLLDLRVAGRSDNLADTINYAQACFDIQAFAGEQEWVLVEHFAEQISGMLFQKYPLLQACGIELRKFIVPQTKACGIRIWRER